jgi:hypothetical protein
VLLDGDSLGHARAAATRLDAAPRLEATLVQGPGGAVTAQLGGRADAWLFDSAPERDRRRLYGFADLRAQTELSRDFGGLRHSIAPSAEVRAFTPALRGGGPPVGDPADSGGASYAAAPDASQQGVAPGLPVAPGSTTTTKGVPAARRAYDEIDGAAPEGGAVQGVLRIDQALWASGGAGRAATRVLELTLAQDVLLWSGAQARAGEAWAAAAAHVGPVSFTARGQYDWSTSLVTGISAGITLADARGDTVRASATAFRALPSELIRGGADELFSTARLARDPGALQGSAGGGLTLKLPIERPPLTLAYGLDRHLGDLPPGFPDTVHHLAAAVDTTCRCAGLQLALDLPFAGGALQSPSVKFVLDLKSLGTFGSP